MMHPTKSIYAFGLNRAKPGYFNLSFLANKNAPIQTWVSIFLALTAYSVVTYYTSLCV